MIKSKKLGVWGGGINSAAGRVHIAASRLDGLWKIVAGSFSRDQSVNKQTKEFHMLEECSLYSTLEDLIDQEQDLDGILVLTPTPLHLDGCKYILEHSSVPIFCEKTVSVSVEECKQLCRLEYMFGNPFFCFFNYTAYPMIREAKNIIENGLIGDIVSVDCNMLQQTFLAESNGVPVIPQPWRLGAYELPCISLDLGVHAISLVEFVTSSLITHASGIEKCLGNFPGIIDYVSTQTVLESGAPCTIKYGKCFLGKENDFNITVYGDAGSLRWCHSRPDSLYICTQGEEKELGLSSSLIEIASNSRYSRFKPGHPTGFIEAFGNYYYDLYHGNRNYTFGLSECLHNLEVIETIHRSANRQCELLSVSPS